MELHKRTVERVEEYKEYIEATIALDPLQDKIDAFLALLKEDQRGLVDIYSFRVDVFVNITHTNEIPAILRKAIEIFGKITKRNIFPEEKTFDFNFDKIKLVFFLTGSSCTLIETGEVDIVKKYKLVCSNGEDTEITADSININE